MLQLRIPKGRIRLRPSRAASVDCAVDGGRINFYHDPALLLFGAPVLVVRHGWDVANTIIGPAVLRSGRVFLFFKG